MHGSIFFSGSLRIIKSPSPTLHPTPAGFNVNFSGEKSSELRLAKSRDLRHGFFSTKSTAIQCFLLLSVHILVS